MFTILLQLLAVQSTSNNCISIKSSKSCSPWNQIDLSIDLNRLADAYGIQDKSQFNLQTWDQLVIDITSGGQKQAELWKNWAQCSKYTGDLIQYYRSYVCLTDIFVLSSSCNNSPPNSIPKLCDTVCDEYGAALNQLMKDEQQCPKTTDSITQTRRSYAVKGADSCKKISQAIMFNHKSECLNGIDSDQKSCGFSGNEKVANLYCAKYPTAPCCSRMSVSKLAVEGGQPRRELSALQRVVMMYQAVGTSESSADQQNSFFSSPTFVMGAAAIVVVIVGVLAFAIVQPIRRARKQARQVPAFVPVRTGIITSKNKQNNGQFKVIYKYDAKLPDELSIEPGQVILVSQIADDSWADAQNLTTGDFGKVCLKFLEKL
ncbi:hypothetical protein BC833DRAFT_587790 [Globomyces pollinis-pini]|nr:hypothetical protein BC833DRAFT_587790 [Globomyces pollinis-pini]